MHCAVVQLLASWRHPTGHALVTVVWMSSHTARDGVKSPISSPPVAVDCQSAF